MIDISQDIMQGLSPEKLYKLDDDTVLEAVDTLDNELDRHLSLNHHYPLPFNRTLNQILNAMEKNRVDFTATKGYSIQTQDFLVSMLENTHLLSKIQKMSDSKNIFRADHQSSLLSLVKRFNLNNKIMGLMDVPKNELKDSEIKYHFKKQKAEAQEIIANIRYRLPDFAQQIKDILDLDNLDNILNTKNITTHYSMSNQLGMNKH